MKNTLNLLREIDNNKLFFDRKIMYTQSQKEFHAEKNCLEIGLVLCRRLPSMTRWIFDYCLAIDSIDINASGDSSLVGKLVNLQCIDADDRGKRKLLAVESMFPVSDITDWIDAELPSYSYTYWQVVLMLFRLGCFGSSILDYPEEITFANFEIELLDQIHEGLLGING